MTISPLRDLVLIKADEAQKKTKSGILLKEDWKSLPPTGEVIAVGPWVDEFRAGDRVLFSRYGAVLLEDGLRLCQEGLIHATLD